MMGDPEYTARMPAAWRLPDGKWEMENGKERTLTPTGTERPRPCRAEDKEA